MVKGAFISHRKAEMVPAEELREEALRAHRSGHPWELGLVTPTPLNPVLSNVSPRSTGPWPPQPGDDPPANSPWA